MRLMIVDDEPAVLLSLRYLLETLGLEVEPFENGEAALNAFRAEPDRFDAVVTDLAMPRLRGNELAREIWRTHPGVPVTLLSGQLLDRSIQAFKRNASGRVLAKPAELSEIVAALRSMGVPISARRPRAA